MRKACPGVITRAGFLGFWIALEFRQLLGSVKDCLQPADWQRLQRGVSSPGQSIKSSTTSSSCLGSSWPTVHCRQR